MTWYLYFPVSPMSSFKISGTSCADKVRLSGGANVPDIESVIEYPILRRALNVESEKGPGMRRVHMGPVFRVTAEKKARKEERYDGFEDPEEVFDEDGWGDIARY